MNFHMVSIMHEETSTQGPIKFKRKFGKHFHFPLKMLSKLIGNKFTRVHSQIRKYWQRFQSQEIK